MKATPRPRVKICCIRSVDEAWMAIEAGASALGLVSNMPSGHGVIPEPLIAEIVTTIPPGVASFLLTSHTDVSDIIAQHARTRVNTLQLCDRLEHGTHQNLRAALPGVAIVQVIHVQGPESVAEAVAAAGSVDAILLDSGNQRIAVKELGGTGRTHDWAISRGIREAVKVLMFLAGGLTPRNVSDAIRQVRLFGVDVCSGVRTGGNLDRGKLQGFFRQIAKV
jgi:phosphoribosylanthranilate isomerase